MKLYLSGHAESFAIQQIYMCIFPEIPFEFSDERPSEGDFAISSFCEHEGKVFSECELSIGGKALHGKACESIPEGCDGEDYKRLKKRVIKLSFYNAAVEFLGSAPKWGALTGIRPSKVAAVYLNDGMNEEEAEKALSRDYFVSSDRAKLAVTAAKRAISLQNEAGERDASLYVGIPFCMSRCKYCSFVSHSIEKARHLVSPYLETLAYELSLLGKATQEAGLSIKSIYIGGGTPTALSASELSFVMEQIEKNFDIRGVAEYTVEAGRADTITREKLEAIKRGGATRISVNPQTMNDDILRAMQRNHTAKDTLVAYETARKVGGLDINMDLIAGLPGDNEESFEDTLRKVIALSPENITVHTLALKKGSTLRLENFPLPSGEATAKMVELSMELLKEAGYAPYYLYRQKYMSGNLENVGYALPGKESLYNNYIMDELHTILSAGAGGVTKLVSDKRKKIERIFNPKYPYEYNEAREKIREASVAIGRFFCEEE